MEARRRDEHPLERRERLQPTRVDPGLLVGLAQGRVHRTRVARVGRPTWERRLPGVVAQGGRTHRDQQVCIVGHAAGR